MNGTIFNIQKFCINDGPGIRTTIFVKGCPLNCAWCHNPESKSGKTELFYDVRKCIGCGRCVEKCPQGCHEMTAEGHVFHRERCVACGNCADTCYSNALEKVGYEISVEEALKEVRKDEIFYQNSGGGLTVSGGEPMYQFAFVFQLLKAAKEVGLHVCMETCGFAPFKRYEEIAPLVDLFLFDYKLTDSELHKQYTGVPNEMILENLHGLDRLGAKTVLRCPIIPTVNDTEAHFKGIAETANGLTHIQGIDIEPYHPLGSGKSELLGKTYELKDQGFPDTALVESWIAAIQKQTTVPVKKG